MPVRWLADLLVWHESFCESGFLFDTPGFLFEILRLHNVQARCSWAVFRVRMSIVMGI